MGALDERVQVALVAVHIAVAQQTHKVQRLPGRAHALDEPAPRLALKQRARVDRGVHQPRALREDTPTAQRVVADLAVAHVLVGRQPHGHAM